MVGSSNSRRLHHCVCSLWNFRDYVGLSVKWLIAILLLLVLQSTGKEICNTREFYSIGWSFHDPTERHSRMVEWLTKHETLCKSSEFVLIWNNLAEWAGTSDSHVLRALVIGGYENAIKREKK